MTQEQKAKAYDEALEWMRKVYPTLTGADKEDAEHYFPEFAESEDERIRKHLIEIVETYWGTTNEPGKAADLAWLEKRKEQKPAENGGKELLYVSNKSYNIGYRDGKMAAEQKTAKWSEEDEKKLELVTDFVFEFYPDPVMKYKLKAWLKSLRPQPIQVKESYKEGFQTARHVAASAFMEYCNKNRPNGKMCLSNGECEDIENAFSVGDWAKIERYIHKYHWNPSEEQMDALKSKLPIIKGTGNNVDSILESLYEQLKKL